eukprot:CAMPEP_0177657060 /NCGR_PEP_ID=MMETSP0447-20121125/15963_1 /TAXON_ID=0 /ORGANISM="Stygamoeba regulata, Strain BSH-02190019" /LENGTH=117 /DNA_ID=CAMNT_0019161349 /DNA_START=254 /DNA_END=603 /DNA_ORIENTATION=-
MDEISSSWVPSSPGKGLKSNEFEDIFQSQSKHSSKKNRTRTLGGRRQYTDFYNRGVNRDDLWEDKSHSCGVSPVVDASRHKQKSSKGTSSTTRSRGLKERPMIWDSDGGSQSEEDGG